MVYEVAANWPQPHEAVVGAGRWDNPLLSLEPSMVAARGAIAELQNHLYSAVLIGNPPPLNQRIYERMSNPIPGDLVIESSARVGRSTERLQRAFGLLICCRQEWWTTDEEWEREKELERAEGGILTDQDRMTDIAWYIQYGPNPEDVCRWTNCSFLVVPLGEDFHQPIGTPQGRGVSLNRDSVVAALNDSGFGIQP